MKPLIRMPSRLKPLTRALILVPLLLVGLTSSADYPAPNAITPDDLSITVKSVDLQTKDAGPFRVNLFDVPHTMDVIGSGSSVGGLFASTDLDPGTFTGVQLTLATNGQFTGTDPCTGDSVTDADVRLAANNGLDDVLVFEQPHPVLGLPAGAVSIDPFTAANGSPINLHIIFPVTNSLVCLADKPPLYNVTGNDTNLTRPFDVAQDTLLGDYVVTGNASNRVTFHNRSDIVASPDGNVLPHYTIVGPDTQLNGPTGVAINDQSATDATQQEIAIANSNNNTIAVYHRSDFAAHADGDLPPAGILGGANTLLNSPGGLYVDNTEKQLVVANGGNNSIAFYALDPNGLLPVGNIAPDFLLTGSATQLSAPCGVQVDNSGNVYVANNRSDSVTEYLRNDFPAYTDNTQSPPQVNLAPLRAIIGPNTEIAAPCGIALDTRQSPPPIAVSSSTTNRILFFNPTDNGDAYPARAMRGSAAAIIDPLGLAIDPQAGEIAVANNQASSLGIYSIAGSDFMPHMHDPPSFGNDTTQQTLYVRYVFAGNLSNTGQPVNSGTPPLPMQYAGYSFAWKIVDNRLRQSGDANSARLFPPETVVWGLADGSVVSSLALSCPSFTPFTTLQLFTNCSQPLITTPFPAAVGDYRLIAALLGAANIKKITLYQAPLTGVQIPRLALTVHIRNTDPNPLNAAVPTDSTIQGMDWIYEDGNGNPWPTDNKFPLIQGQSMQIELTRPYTDVDACYKQTAGNSSNLVYASPAMGRNIRALTDVTNNGCPILLKDIDTINFTATDSLGTNYIYELRPLP